MRCLWFMPMTFLAGQHGFALFAPYLAIFLASAHLIRMRRPRAERATAAVSLPTAAVAVA